MILGSKFLIIKKTWLKAVLVLSVSLMAAAGLQAQVTFAGTQVVVAGGANFSLSGPSSVAVDGGGNVYIADRGNDRILMVSASGGGFGTPQTLLGNLSAPAAVAADWSGNVFIADTGNDRVLMIATASKGQGTATTIATGLNMPSGIAVDSADNVYICDTGNNRIVELPFPGSATNSYGSAVVVSTGLNQPTQVSVDSKKTLYIADTGNNRIIKTPLTATGYITQQVLGVGTTSPMGVAVDINFDMYIADTGKGKINESTWNLGGRFNTASIVGGGFGSPQGMISDAKGGIYVADATLDRVVELVPASVNFGSLTVGSTPMAQSYQFEIYAGTNLDTTSIYAQGVVGKDFVDAGESTCAAGTYSVSTLCVVNVNFAPLGSGERDGAIVLYDTSGNPLATAFISGTGVEPQVAYFPGTTTYLGTGLSAPSGVAVDGSGNVFISDTGNDRVVEVASAGTGYATQTTVLDQGLSSPMGLAIDGADNLYVVSNGNDKVLRMAWLGEGYAAPTKVGSGLYGPTNVAVDGVGNVYVTDTLDSRLWKLSWTGNTFSTEQKLGDYVHFPVGVAVDPGGNLYFSSPYQNSLAVIPLTAGNYQRQAYETLQGTSFPSAIAIDGNANLYILDTANNKVVMLPSNGNTFGAQITVASGFNAPQGIALDTAGNLYVADTGNNQVVKINLAVPAPLNFGAVYEGSSSLTQTTILQNIGNTPLQVSSITYPADFPQAGNSTNLCSANSSVVQGSNCQISATLTPLSANSGFAEVVNIVDNTLNIPGSQQFVALSGAGTGELAQTVALAAIANVVYGAPSIALTGSASSGLPVTYSVVSGPASISGGQKLAIQGVGTVVLIASQPGNATYQAAPSVRVSFTIFPAVLTVTPASVSAVYGDVPTNFKSSITGFVLGQSAGQVLSGVPLITYNTTGGVKVGNFKLTASQGSLIAANYTFVSGSGWLTVTPAALTVSAVSTSSAYGSWLPTLAWRLSGLVNGDNAGVVTGSPMLTTSATLLSKVGSYAIVPSLGSLASANYTFAFSNGTLIINKAQVTFKANAQVCNYGTCAPTLTYSVAGFVGSDTLLNSVKGIPSITSPVRSSSAAGTYPIVVGFGTLNSTSYNFIFAANTVTVQKAIASVIPVNATIVYGQKIPSLTYTVSGLVNQDTMAVVSGTPVLNACLTSCTGVGVYKIAAAVGSLSARNYSFSAASGTLTVNPALLTVTPNPVSVEYGQAIPAITYVVSGLVGGDKLAVVSGEPSLSTIANQKSRAGSYPIVGSLGTLTAKNYIFTTAPGVVAIKPAVLTITPTNATMTYGSAVPALGFSVSGLTNGDTQAEAISGLPQLSSTGTKQSKIGTYVISASTGTLKSSNYVLQFNSGVLTIARAPLTISVIHVSMKAGGKLPVFTWNATGLVNGETIAVAINGIPSLTTAATSKSKAGSYVIDAAKGTMKTANYQLIFVDGTLTVTP